MDERATLKEDGFDGVEAGEDDPLAGTPYRFVRKIGEGGMGEVVEAAHGTLGHHVAIKLLRAEYFASFEIRERMRLEAQACARVRHESLVPVHDFGATLDGQLFVVMDLLRGRSLADELSARGALPAAEAADIACQALAGLGAAHAAGIVHRDVKPQNLFLCDPEAGARRVKVLDFGIAKIVRQVSPLTPEPPAKATAEGMTVGTARWSSPEQGRGERDIDARSDLYSLGWVLYAMLTGRAPFPHLRSAGELFAAHAKQMPAPPSVAASQPVPATLDAIVMKALAKRREERFESADAFRAVLWGAAQDANRSALARTVEQGPLFAAPAHTRTVEPPGTAVVRPVLPWPAAGGAPRSRAVRGRRGPPAWFWVVVAVGVGATVAVAALYLWLG